MVRTTQAETTVTAEGAVTPSSTGTVEIPVTPEVIKQEKVEIFVPKGYSKDDPNVFISVAGKNYIIPRGVRTLVPREVADEYYRAARAQNALDAKIAEMTANTQPPAV